MDSNMQELARPHTAGNIGTSYTAQENTDHGGMLTVDKINRTAINQQFHYISINPQMIFVCSRD